jgi:hypothetical protein
MLHNAVVCVAACGALLAQLFTGLNKQLRSCVDVTSIVVRSSVVLPRQAQTVAVGPCTYHVDPVPSSNMLLVCVSGTLLAPSA